MEMALEEVQKLRKMLEQKEQELLDEYQGKKILGFNLSKSYTLSPKGKKYLVWRAHLCKNGNKAIVHIGKDPRAAENKIKAYLTRYPKFGL